MLKTDIKKVLIETKEKQHKLLIEEKIVKNRIMMIVESKNNIKNFHLLSEEKRLRISFALLQEFHFLTENGMLNEQLGDFLGKIFGNSFSGIIQTIAEPLVDSILGGLGFGGYFKDFMVSLLTTNPSKLIAALKDCKALTGLVVESLTEGMFMMIIREKGMGGKGADFLRNALGGAVKDTKFVSSLEASLEGFVCGIFNNFTGKAEQVYDKLKPTTATVKPAA
jgi:hypothetical protein